MEIRIYLNYFFFLCIVAFIFYNFQILDPAIPLHFSNSFIRIIKNNNLLYKGGLFKKLVTASYVKKDTADITFL